MWYVILSSDSEDAAGGVWHVWNRREYEWIPKSIAGGVSWRIGRFSNWLVVQWSSSDLVLVIKEGRCLHDAANDVVVRWSLEQVHESILHILCHSLAVWVDFVWSCEEATGWCNHLIVLLLSLAVENPTAVDNSNWGKFRVFSNHLLIVVWRSMRSSGKDTLWRSAGLDNVALSRSDHIRHNDWAFILLADR